MNAIRRTERRQQSSVAEAALPMPFTMGETGVRENLIAARDTFVVLGVQMMLRTMLVFRHWIS